NLLARLPRAHLQPARITRNLAYNTRARNPARAGHEFVNALLSRGVHSGPGSPVAGHHNAFLHGARWTGEFKGHWHWSIDQIVIGVDDIYGTRDAVMQSNLKPGGFGKKGDISGLALRHNIEGAALCGGASCKNCPVLAGVI